VPLGDREAAEDIAQQLVEDDPDAARALVQAIERRLGTEPLARVERVWGLSGAEVAAIFGVSREGYRKWRSGVPPERADAVAALDRATQVLLGKVKVDRIPAYVRRPVPLLGGRTLYEIARTAGPLRLVEEVEGLFDIRRVQP
jgi:hypothetical protein